MNHVLIKIMAVSVCVAALCGCESKNSKSQQNISVPCGTYTYANEDGKVSKITVSANTFSIQNGNYKYCPKLYEAKCIMSASAEAEAKGLVFSEEEKNKIIAASKAIDFSAYDGTNLTYHLEDVDTKMVNLIAEDANGNDIVGLWISYYVDDRTLGFGDGYYVLGQE